MEFQAKFKLNVSNTRQAHVRYCLAGSLNANKALAEAPRPPPCPRTQLWTVRRAPMSSHPPVVFHERKHLDLDGHHAHTPVPLLPVIPDLRFESSYVRSVRRYIDVERGGPTSTTDSADADLLTHALIAEEYDQLDAASNSDGQDTKNSSEGTGAAVRPGPSEIIRVQWGSVIWVTLRDQLISPLVQGALW